MKDLVFEMAGTYHIPDVPTHRSRAHKNSKSYLDGCIISDSANLEKMEVLTEDEFPNSDSDHLPILLEVNLQIPNKKDKKEEDNSWPYNEHKKIHWHQIDKKEYSRRCDTYLGIVEKCCSDLPWSVRFKIIMDMMNEAANDSRKEPDKLKDYRLEELREAWINMNSSSYSH